MANGLEGCMIVSLCVAVAILLYGFIRHKGRCAVWERVCVITIGLGFLMGAISKAMCQVVPWTFVLYLAGADLCYTAALFSFPGKQNEEIKGNGHE